MPTKQNIDPFIGDVLNEKLEKFDAEGEGYKKKSADMKFLTEIEMKTKQKQRLTKNNLIFLYEIDSKIEGFGYQRNPRIEEIRKTRNPKEDAAIIFECQSSEIAWKPEDINENTKAYIGKWNNIEIFQKIKQYPDIKYLYETFPDKKIIIQTLKTNPDVNSPELARKALKEKNIYLTGRVKKDILYKTEFSQKSQTYELVRFTVEQLGFPNGATTDEVYKRAEDLGLELCPAEVGPHLRLQYSGKEL